MAKSAAQALSDNIAPPPREVDIPEPEQILFGMTEPPPFPEDNIFPLEWDVETPKLQDIYEASREPGWSPATLPWETLDPDQLTADQRYAISYWFSLLSVFDSSGPSIAGRIRPRGRPGHSVIGGTGRELARRRVANERRDRALRYRLSSDTRDRYRRRNRGFRS